MDTQEQKDPKDRRAAQVIRDLKGRRDREGEKACLDRGANPDPLVLERRETKAAQVMQDFQGYQASLGQWDTKVQWAVQDLQALEALLVCKVSEETQDSPVQKVTKDQLDQQDQRVIRGRTDLVDLQVTQACVDCQDPMERLELKGLRVHLVQMDTKAPEVTKDQSDCQGSEDHPDPQEMPAYQGLVDHRDHQVFQVIQVYLDPKVKQESQARSSMQKDPRLWLCQAHQDQQDLLAPLDLPDSQVLLVPLEIQDSQAQRDPEETGVCQVKQVSPWRPPDQSALLSINRSLEVSVLKDPQARPAHQDLQALQFKVLPAPEEIQVLVNQECRVPKESQGALCPIQEHSLQDLLGLLDFPGQKGQRVNKDQEDTQVSQASQVCPEVPVVVVVLVILEEANQVHLDHQGYQVHKAHQAKTVEKVLRETEGMLESQVLPEFQGQQYQEVVTRVSIRAPLALQGPPEPLVLLDLDLQTHCLTFASTLLIIFRVILSGAS